jgi:hypothetical protein
MHFFTSIVHYLWIVFGNVWGILLLLTGAVDLWERFFDRKTTVPAWLRASIFVAVVIVAQAVAYEQLADNPPVVLHVKPPPAPIIQLAEIAKSVASTSIPKTRAEQVQSGHDNVQSGSITQGPCSSVQQGGSGNQANVNCGPPPLVLTVASVDSPGTAFPPKEGFVETEITIVPNQEVTAPFTIALEFDNPISDIAHTVKNVGAQMGGGPFTRGIHARETVSTSIG